MAAELIVLLALVLLLLLLASGVPVALCLAAAGAAGVALLRGENVALATLASTPYATTASFTLIVIPMFVLMGVLAARAGLAADVFRACHRLLGRLPGGLALASVGACAGFAAVSGSSNAMVATLGPVTVSEMRRYRYDHAFAAGVVASAGTIGIMIPPSITLVIYAIVTEESIAAVLIAGLIPGLLSALLYVIAVLLWGWQVPRLVGQGPAGAAETLLPAPLDRQTWTGIGKVLVLFLVVMGGIYAGVFTPTEAAALGALAALLMLLLTLRRAGLGRIGREVGAGLMETASISSFIFIIVVGAAIFTYFLVSAGVPSAFARWAVALDLPPQLIVGLLLLAMIPLGMFLDPISIMLIVLPLAHPVVVEFGYSGVWFGVLVVQAIEIGLITPPVGLNVFIVAGVTGVPTGDVFKGVMYFLPIQLVTLVILFFVPELSTWLPGVMTR